MIEQATVRHDVRNIAASAALSQPEKELTMHISKMKQSRYLKTADVDPEVLVTISKVELEEIDDDEQKYVLYTNEFEKGLVLNWTNAQLVAKATGSEDTEGWPGKQVILYHDETVQFKGQVVGGIRIRAVKKKAAPKADDDDPNDPIPGWDDIDTDEDVA